LEILVDAETFEVINSGHHATAALGVLTQ
jgi:hypothetical protein